MHDHADNDSRVLARTRSMLGGRTVAQAMSEIRAVIGAEIPFGAEDAQRCLAKIELGEPYSAVEWAAVELVVRLLRPAPPTHEDQAVALPLYGSREPELPRLWEMFRARSAELVPSVGRIADATGTHVGTGFVVAPNLVLTNRHVLSLITFGTERLIPGSTINFRSELNAADCPDSVVNLVSLETVHADLDLALLRVAGAPAPLRRYTGLVADEAWVVAVGYPGVVTPTPLYAASVFGAVSTLGVRRTSPGTITDSTDCRLSHDCSTMGGSSGSPLLAIETGEVVGVHYEGRSAYENHAVPISHVETMLAEKGGRG